MTDRLLLANALVDAKIDRSAAERIATVIFDAIHDNTASKADLREMELRLKQDLLETEHRLTVRFASVMVILQGPLFAALRYLPPAHSRPT